MIRWAFLFAAALLAADGAMSAHAQTTAGNEPNAPAIYGRAKHHKHKKPEPEGRQITVHKGTALTPSQLTAGTQVPVGTGNNYVTDTFDAPTPIEGTFSGWRGRERIIPQYGVPGAPLFTF